ncbi:MAG TPA: tRNA lysidine(34) synthetase TilS [Terriglobales bacterium]|nr:tRNA lysidine(34) synthetase TilS [Terriglobales bacterium]
MVKAFPDEYHEPVELAAQVANFIGEHELLKPGHRTAIAVSGGLDSVALLLLALELKTDLGIVLSVVHFNHQLRGLDSESDEQFVADLAQQHDLEFHCQSADVKRHSQASHQSLEAAARELRYKFFRELLKEKKLDRVATAHTLDDQAETVILRLARGSGTRGLAGIYPQIHSTNGDIIRPLLQTRRSQLEAYLQLVNQSWREDESNNDQRHTRNRVRHTILPLLERELNPSLREALAETADLSRDEEDYWKQEVARVLPQVSKKDHSLTISRLLGLPLALQRRVIRQVAEPLALEQKHVAKILEVANGRARSTELPQDWLASSNQDELIFQQRTTNPADYEYPLPVPGSVQVPELNSLFEATPVSNSEAGTLTVRNWRAGDRFWPAHSKGTKKVKELLQEKKITRRERHLWPVVAWETHVLWVRGFPSPAARDDFPAVVIRERPL